jgi:hypothetical protein
MSCVAMFAAIMQFEAGIENNSSIFDFAVYS